MRQNWALFLMNVPIQSLDFTPDLEYSIVMTIGQESDEDTGGYSGPVPPPSEPPPRAERHWIEQSAEMATMIRVLSESAILAIDVEFVPARPADSSSTPRLALIQIANDHLSFVIDGLRFTDLSPLASLFERETILKIFHGVGSDLRVLGSRGITVRHLLDLEAVSRSIFGTKESGLQAMLQRACNIRLDKTLQRSDWTQRPLPTAMFAYAARDAEMTLALYGWLQQHFAWAIDLYEERPSTEPLHTQVAPWLASFIDGERSFPQELLDAAGGELDPVVLTQDCLTALKRLVRPVWRARVLRAAADLMLTEIIPYAEILLTAKPAEERAAAARALGRLRAVNSYEILKTVTNDPVADVRKAARLALEQLPLPPRPSRFARSEPSAEPAEEGQADVPWKDKLRGLLPPDNEN
jgi:3'-5' exonuclease